jgi:hypothetical protein
VNNPNQVSSKPTGYYWVILLILLLPPFVYAQPPLPGISSRFIVIGDAGKLRDGKNVVVEAATHYISIKDSITTVLFLGDNSYPKGLPDEEDKAYPSSAAALRGTLTPFRNHRATIYMVPGNHDWQKGGSNGWQNIKRQGQFVTSLNQHNAFFLPTGGCPGPEEIIINHDLVLIIMDTQWWLHANDKPGIHDDCECKTEEEVLTRLRDIVYRNSGRKILFAAHHPLRSYGAHGGYYTWKQHIFPLTDLSSNAYFPFPVIGSLYPFIRGNFGNIEDLIHPLYKDMIRGIETALSQAPEVTYVSGHDHNLQLIEEQNRKYVVSGSGANRGRVKAGKKTLFASDENGFAEIVYTSDGGQTIQYHSVDEKGNRKILYTYQALRSGIQREKIISPERKTFPDSVTVGIAPEYNEVSNSHRKIWGEHYRKIWATPVRLSVFRLNEQYGGLTILKRGGGSQTKSLRMRDGSGKQWVLRTIQKNPELALPSNLRATVAKTIIQDQISAANPFAPLTVPMLATAANVPHADPKILFVPDDPAFGIYRAEFANTICIFEEREPGVEETISTSKVLEKLKEDNDTRVDQRAVLRARMLDLLIGDWDRHEDQWRWKKEKTKNKTIYSPIPRDRDQVFFVNTGIIPIITSRKWLIPKFQGFSRSIRDVNGFMYNGRYFDRSFLNELDRSDWKEVISEIQSSITDQVIRQSVRQLPDTIFRLVGDTLIGDLISRRNDLMKYGLTYYSFLSSAIDIPASDKRDLFRIDTKSNGDATVTLQKIKKDDSPGDTLYQRTVDKETTREVRLYGRGGQDVFVVEGNYKPGFKIRMIGGGAVDSFYVDPHAASGRRLFLYDRSDQRNKYSRHGVSLRTSKDNDVNQHNSRSFRYDRLAPLATIGFNLDDGMQLGAGGVYTTHGFRREPFAARHRLLVGKSLATRAFFLRYKGEITDVIGKTDLDIYLNTSAPANTSNFFGVGNETTDKRISDAGIRYYRTRYDLIDIQLKLKWSMGKSFNVFAGPATQYFSMSSDENKDRYINEYAAQQNDPSLFSHKIFVGGVIGYEVDTRNNGLLPIRGIHWRTTFMGMQQTDRSSDPYGQARTDMSMYLSFSRYPKVVIAHRIGAGTSLGEPQFFQMLSIGGEGTLQGYRKYRFAGSSMIYDNVELRVKLFDFASFLFPGSVGLIGFNDVGRVWVTNEASDKWHWGYGGGFYIIPAGAFVIAGVAGFSKEGVLPHITMGFRY